MNGVFREFFKFPESIKGSLTFLYVIDPMEDQSPIEQKNESFLIKEPV